MHEFDVASFPMKQTISLVAKMLKSTLHINDACKATPKTCFHADPIPSSSVEELLLRIQKYAPFNNECLLSALIYLDRAVQCSKETNIPLVVNSHNVHRLLITSLVIASKYCSDVYFSNSHYAQIAGIHPKDFNVLEIELLFLCQFDLMVHPFDLRQFGNHLLKVQTSANNANVVLPCTQAHVQTILPLPKRETSLKPGKTSVALYVNDLADIMKNTDLSCQRLNNQSIVTLKNHLTAQASKTKKSATPLPPLLDNSLMQVLFNPHNQISSEKREQFLMLLNRCRKKIMSERKQPLVKRLIH